MHLFLVCVLVQVSYNVDQITEMTNQSVLLLSTFVAQWKKNIIEDKTKYNLCMQQKKKRLN